MSCVEYECAALLLACEDGDLMTVENLLGDGVPANSAENNGVSALHLAAANGHVDVAKVLLSYSADVDQPDSFGWTALLQSSRHGHTQMVKLLLEHGANKTWRNRLGCDASMMAAAGGHIHVMQILGETDTQPSNGMYMTPFLVACLQGHERAVTLLAQDPNEHLESSGMTALMLAAAGGHRNIVEMLVEGGADPTVTNAMGLTALDIALARGHGEVESILDQCCKNRNSCPVIPTCSKMSDSSTLVSAAFQGDVDSCRRLVTQGGDVNQREMGTGWTPLMHATMHNQMPVARFLLESGADVNLTDDNGYTALDLAAVSPESNSDLIKVLAERGAQIKQTIDNSEETMALTPNPSETPSPIPMTAVHHDCVHDLPWLPRRLASDDLRPVLPPLLPHDDSVHELGDLLEDKRALLRQAMESRASPDSVPRSRMKRFREEEEDEDCCHPSKTRAESPVVEDGGDPEVEEVLKKLSLEKYCPLFEEHEIDMDALFALTELDMKEIGMQTLDRKALMKVIYG